MYLIDFYLSKRLSIWLTDIMKSHVLQENPSADQDSWQYQLPDNALASPWRKDQIVGKIAKFTTEAITLSMDNLPSNHILQTDDPAKFILASFSDLHCLEHTSHCRLYQSSHEGGLLSQRNTVLFLSSQ
jgi:hypothetical protein